MKNKNILKTMFVVFVSLLCMFFSINKVFAASESTNIDGVSLVYVPLEQNFSKGVTIKPEYIVIHDTGNRGVGATAMANRNYFNTTSREASAQFIVDDKQIVQALPSTAKAWHIGDGKQQTKASNDNSIGIELCVNNDGDFGVTFQNGIKLTKYLMKKYNIPAENVIRHYDATKKICPRIMIEDDPTLWTRFKAEIQKNKTTIETPTTNNTEKKKEKKSNYQIPSEPNARVVGSDVDVKSQPSKEVKTIDFIKQGTFLKVKEKVGDSFCKIEYNGKEGYISIDNVKLFEQFNFNKRDDIKENFNLRKRLVTVLSLGLINEDTMSR